LIARFCIASRNSHLFRCGDPVSSKQGAKKHDDMVAKLISSIMRLPEERTGIDDDNPLSWVWRQARLPLRHGGLGTASAEKMRAAAYYGSLSLAAGLLHDLFGDLGVPDVVSSNTLPFELSPLTTPVEVEDAVLALSDNNQFPRL
jgi:hypothetical protein